MRMSRAVLFGILFLGVSSSMMAVNRAFVSGNGMDTGACPITAPCRSFAYALTQITAGGEIIALDTAGYGAATISQAALIIAAPGVTAFSTGTSGTVITVAAGSSDNVTLHGITVTANGPTVGVAFISGHVLGVENCIINGHAIGIAFGRTAETGSPKLHVINCIVRNNTTGIDVANMPMPVIPTGLRAMAVAPPPTDLLYVTVAGSAFLDNATGLQARDNARVTATDTVFTGHSSSGVVAEGDDSFPSVVALEHCAASDNAIGVQAGDSSGSQLIHGVVKLANCTITHNVDGLVTTVTGSSLSRISSSTLTNTIEGNYIDGVFSGNYLAK